ncbi:metallophosphoesterase [Actinotalea sp.]|uniref:metallophosphoesterase family protein n=1 Tax=Actinotalea sp. TaxID=1872145 RepID=UPI003566890A
MDDPWHTMSDASPLPTDAMDSHLDLVPSRRRRRWRVAALVALIVFGSLTWGVATATAEGTFGPHLARYAVTVDGAATVDLGPLGTLVIDSPVPVLGARVTVQEIPASLTTVDLATTLENLSSDLQEYLELFSAPQEALGAAIEALVLDALTRAGLLAAALLLSLAALRWLLGPSRRVELAATWGRHSRTVSAGVVLVLVAGGTLSASVPRTAATGEDRQASAVFDGTPLEGARLTGRLAGLIDTYGGYAVTAYRENEAFYDGAATALDEAWTDRAEVEAAAAERTALISPSATTDADAATSEDPIVAVVVSDLHCNVGMARVIGRLATVSDADLVLNAGDSTMDGTSVESYCVDAFAAAVPAGTAYVIADGNHDSAETAAQERAAGARVLDGQVIEVAGLRILGDSDPHETRVGSGTSRVGEEGVAEVGNRLADVACTDGDVDLLLVHDPDVGTEALERGCVPAQVSGHWHRRIGPLWTGEGVRYVSSSTAGAILNEPTVGPLNGTAELTILRFDRASGAISDSRVVQVRPDGTVAVGPAVGWPVRPVSAPRWGDPV